MMDRDADVFRKSFQSINDMTIRHYTYFFGRACMLIPVMSRMFLEGITYIMEFCSAAIKIFYEYFMRWRKTNSANIFHIQANNRKFEFGNIYALSICPSICLLKEFFGFT